MPFGDTAKKLQKVTTMAEDTYEKMNELYTQLNELRARLDRTTEAVETIERDLAEQRALVEALAEKEGLDVDAILAEHAESTAEEASDGDESGTSSGDGSNTAGGDRSSASGEPDGGSDGTR